MSAESSKLDWKSFKRVLLVRLRSIGDSVLATPTISIIKEKYPDIEVDFLLEEWVAPLFENHPQINRVIVSPKSLTGRLALIRGLRKRGYDAILNLHGGTTAGFITSFSGAKHSIGSETFQYPFLYSIKARHPHEVFGREDVHSTEQQAVLLKESGLSFEEVPATSISASREAEVKISNRLKEAGLSEKRFALIHPLAAYPSKTWAADNYSEIARYLNSLGYPVAVLVTGEGRPIAERISERSEAIIFDDLKLAEVPALTKAAGIFVGNDSGIAHIAAATKTPLVVVFGSSNPIHWKPWSKAPARVVNNDFSCQPCPGDICREFGEPRCIQELSVSRVRNAIDEILEKV